MDLLRKPSLRAVVMVGATLLTATAYFWSFGLQPIWWLVWLAPLPVLLVAPRVRGWQTLAMAFAARALAGLNLWSYARNLIHIPLWPVVAMVVVPAIWFALAVLLYRGLLRRGRPWLASLAFPAVMVAAEYLISLSQGTFGNTGYTQLRDLPVLQLGALTGLWGIGFTVMLFPAAIAALFHTRSAERRRMAVALAAFLAAVVIYGEWRLHATPPTSESVVVGLIETETDVFPQRPQVLPLMQGYAGQVQKLASEGAQFIVLPEMTALVGDPLSGQVDALFKETARDAHVQILLGVLHLTGGAAYNEARLYSTAGTVENVYRKHHLVPSLETRTTPGTEISVLPQPEGVVGLQICRDLDYPELARRYAKRDVGLLLVPAWDQTVDRVWHGHMSLMRAVEDGFSLVRNAKHGLLTVSDDRGRILAETKTSGDTPFNTMLARVPVRHDATLYEAWGDWFAWLDLAAVCGLVGALVMKSRALEKTMEEKPERASV